MRCGYNTLISPVICQVVTYGRSKKGENFQLLALKMVAVANERWLLARGSKYSDLTFVVILENRSLGRGGIKQLSRLSVFASTRKNVLFSCKKKNGRFQVQDDS